MAKILIVDDDKNLLILIKDILKKEGHEPTCIINPENTIKIIEKENFDLVILDSCMPGKSGIELCRDISKIKNYKFTPIIFLTAQDNNHDIVSAFESGAYDYITKPFNSKVLIARIRIHLKLKENSDQIKQYANELEYKNRLITDSINYANHIQMAILPSLKELQTFFPSSFIFNKPKDIVSGDFFWIKKINNRVFLALADSTGHGVGGAFMSTLGISSIEYIVSHNHHKSTGVILDLLRSRIKSTMRKGDDIHFLREGFDIAFCCFELNNNTLQYSGAYIPLIIIRDGKIIKIDPDKQPVSSYEQERSFTTHQIELKTDDKIYLYTDGFVDQFGGPNGKRYMRKSFRKFILETSIYSPKVQKEILSQELNNWKGDTEQTDDILLLNINFDKETYSGYFKAPSENLEVNEENYGTFR